MLTEFLWVIAALMALVTSFLIKRASMIRSKLNAYLIIYLFAMMVFSFLGLTIYELNQSEVSLALVFLFNSILVVAGLLFILVNTKKWKEEDVNSSVFRASVIFLAMLSEFLMGLSFILITDKGTVINYLQSNGLSEVFGLITTSYWFVFTMVGEMVLTSYFLRRELPKDFLMLIAYQSLIMLFMPPAINDPSWVYLTSIGGVIVMGIAFIWLIDFMLKSRLNANTFKYSYSLLTSYIPMMVGLYLWSITGELFVLSIGIIAEMVIYFNAAIMSMKLKAEKVALNKRNFSILLGLTIASMIPMGGLLMSITSPMGSRDELLLPYSDFYIITFLVTGLILALTIPPLYTTRIYGGTVKIDGGQLSERSIIPFWPGWVNIVIGALIFPFAVRGPLDDLADNNPNFHMLAHFLIGLSGFLIAFGVKDLITRHSTGNSLFNRALRYLSKIYVLYAKYSLRGYLGVIIAVLVFSIWATPQFLLMADQSDTVHEIGHMLIFLAGIFTGASLSLISRSLRATLLVSFIWMTLMMVPFVLTLGPFSIDISESVKSMSIMMYSWIANLIAALILDRL
jgi:hypothetical protein